MAWTKFADMELTDDEKFDAVMPMPMPHKPDYPYGLRITLCTPELEKLGVEADCDVGDTIDLRAFGVVTSVTKDGENCRVEIQLQKIAVEDEDDEVED